MSTRAGAVFCSAFVVLLIAASCSSGTGGGTGGGAGGGTDGGSTTCGNGTLETNEACEGFELRGKSCTSEGFEVGQLRCSATCVLDLSDCSKCGDGNVTGAELCDPQASAPFGPKSCANQLDAGALGELGCADNCTRISTASCNFPPARNEPCSVTTGCSAGLICDLVSSSPLTFRCRPHCPLVGAGTAQGCDAGELCTDGTVEIEGATAMPPAYVQCPTGTECGSGFGCLDAGTQPGYCSRRVGYCQ